MDKNYLVDCMSSDIINLTTSVTSLCESLKLHNKFNVKAVLSKLKNIQGKLNQTCESINKVRKNIKQLGRIDLNRIINELTNNLCDYKISIINLLYCLETSHSFYNLIVEVLKSSKRFILQLNTKLDNINSPVDIRNKILHYQNSEVKSQLNDVPNRGFFKYVFEEAHHQSKSLKAYPNFDKRGDWYHDGILTHWDGEKFEDIYLRPNGRKLSCGFLVQDENTGKYLGCHPTGQPKGVYDIPKGCKNVGADDLETAIRELKEETGLEVSEIDAQIEDLGIHNQKKDKDVHLFKIVLPIDIEKLHCDSTFIDFRDGVKKSEMDGFELVDDFSKFLFSIQPILKLCM